MEKPELIRLDPETINETGKAFRAFLQKPRFIGQERLQNSVIRAVGRFEGTLRNPDKPVRSILVLGSSGTGKTMMFELAAEFLFGAKSAFTKLSGPEYREEHTVSKLIGSPPGYIGFNADERGPFPMLSPWNIGKYHYFKMLNNAAEKIKAEQGKFGFNATEAKNLLEQLYHDEVMYSDRIATLSEAVGALECGDEPHPPVQKSNQEKRMALIETCKDYIAIITRFLLGTYRQIDKLVALLSQESGHDMSFNPAIHKRAILLADEIDKAHPAFHNLFYEILDRGRVTLQNGTVTDFSETIVGMTSNKGDKEMEEIMRGRNIGFRIKHKTSEQEKQQELYKAARNAMTKLFFAPMRGRIDEVEVTHEFTAEQIKDIIRMAIDELQELLTKRKTEISLRISEEVVDFLWRESTDKPEEGARLVQKKLNHYLRDPVDSMMQTGQLHEGDTLFVDMETAEEKRKPVFRADTSNRKK